MQNPTQCPKCNSEHIYNDGNLWICPECSNEWNPELSFSEEIPIQNEGIRDSNGNLLLDGDSVTVIKELKIKGSASSVKAGTKVKNIRLVDGVDGHDIACKIDGIGAINLKSEFVRKA
jgi:protein PhnA